MQEIINIVKPTGEHDSLAPCPFCGNKEIAYAQYQHPVGLRWKVVCFGCTAEINPGYCREMYQIRERWNRRADK